MMSDVEGVDRPRLNTYPCATSPCSIDAKVYRDSIDLSVNPCQDFFNYACGNWIKNIADKFSSRDSPLIRLQRSIYDRQANGLLSGRSNVDAVKKAMAMYSLCQRIDSDVTTASSIQYVFKTTGVSFPSLHCEKRPWNPKTYNFYKEMFQYSIKGLDQFFQFYVYPDYMDPRRNILKVEVLPLLIESPAFYQKFKAKVEVFYTDLLKSFSSSRYQYSADVFEILQFDKRAIQIMKTVPPSERRYTFFELQKEITKKRLLGQPALELTYLIKNLADYVKRNYPDFDNSNTIKNIVVVNPDRLSQYAILINEFQRDNPRVLPNKAAINTLISLKQFLPIKLRDIIYAFYDTEHMNSYNYRKIQCLGIMPHAEARFFLDDSNFQRSLFVDHLMKETKLQLNRLVQESKFMDGLTKQEAVAKVSNIVGVQGYEDWLRNDHLLNLYYHKVRIVPGDALRSYLTITSNSFENTFKSLDKSKYGSLGTGGNIWNANAYITKDGLKFAIMAAILYPPYYREGSASAINFGSIGNVIGHELGHAIDTTGKNFDSKGVKRNWWTQYSEMEFLKRANCVARQYSGYSIPSSYGAFFVDGKYTLNENMADILGVRVAYRAFKEYQRRFTRESYKVRGLDYSPDQLFFLGYAYSWCEKVDPNRMSHYYGQSVHSPNIIRVKGPLTGFKPFLTAFNCPPTSAYAGPSCNVWE